MYRFRSLILSFLVMFAAAVCGMRLAGEIPFALSAAAAVGCLAVLTVLFILNFTLTSIKEKQLARKTVRETQEELLTAHEKAKENFRAAAAKMHTAVLLTILYLIGVLVLAAGSCFFTGAAFGWNPLLLPGLYFLFCTVDRMCCISLQPLRIDTIAGEEYPRLNALIEEARALFGLQGQKLFILPENSCNAGIAEIPGGYSLMLGVPLMGVLNEEELKQILIHEFAHVANQDTRIRFISVILMGFMTAPSVNPLGKFCVLYRFPALKFNEVFQKFNISASFVCEEKADAAIAEHGNPALTVDAMAKISAYSLYQQEDRRNLFAEYDTVPDHVCSVNVNAFREQLEKRGEAWKPMILKELPALLNSHPSFNQRREVFGIEDFSLSLKNADPAFKEETRRLAKFVDGRICQRMKQDYSIRRKWDYLDCLERIEAWENSDRTTPPEKMRRIIDSYMALNRFDEAIALCDETLARAENENAAAHPLYVRGSALLRKGDPVGMDSIRQAMEINSGYIQHGLNQIGDFARRMGMADELEAYRASYPDIMQKVNDTIRWCGTIAMKDKLLPARLSEEEINTHRDILLELGGNLVRELYVLEKIISPEFSTTVFVIRPKRGTTPDEFADRQLDMLIYLDTLPGKKHYSVIGWNNQIALAVKKVKKSRLYKK